MWSAKSGKRVAAAWRAVGPVHTDGVLSTVAQHRRRSALTYRLGSCAFCAGHQATERTLWDPQGHEQC